MGSPTEDLEIKFKVTDISQPYILKRSRAKPYVTIKHLF